MTKAMTKAQKFLNDKKESLHNIEVAIDSLQDELIELEKSKVTGEGEFDTKAVKQNKKIAQEITTTKEVLETAKQRKADLIKGQSLDTYKQARNHVLEYKKEKQDEHKADNLEIIDAINMIREKVAYLKQKDTEYYNEIKGFVDDIKPFLDSENRVTPNSNNTPHPDMLQNILDSSMNSRPHQSVLHGVNERPFLIEGLIKQPTIAHKSEEVEKARFS